MLFTPSIMCEDSIQHCLPSTPLPKNPCEPNQYFSYSPTTLSYCHSSGSGDPKGGYFYCDRNRNNI